MRELLWILEMSAVALFCLRKNYFIVSDNEKYYVIINWLKDLVVV